MFLSSNKIKKICSISVLFIFLCADVNALSVSYQEGTIKGAGLEALQARAISEDAKTIKSVLERDPQITSREYFAGYETEYEGELRDIRESAVLEYIQSIPKSVLDEQSSGLIYPEHLIEYLLDDEPNSNGLSEEELSFRLKKRQEARRRFVLTARRFQGTSGNQALLLQSNPVNAEAISQEEADYELYMLLEIEGKVSFRREDLENQWDQIVSVFQEKFILFNDPGQPWEKFEKRFTYIKSIVDAHSDFKRELIKKGIRRQVERDNLVDLEISDYYSEDFLELSSIVIKDLGPSVCKLILITPL